MNAALLKHGNVVDEPCDLIAVPCSTAGTIGKVTGEIVNRLQLPRPTPMKMGEVAYQRIENSDVSAKFIAWCASVHENSSDVETIEKIGEELGKLTRKLKVRTVNSPIFGIGAGGLNPESAIEALLDGFRSSCHPDAGLIVFSPDSNLVHDLTVPFLSFASRQSEPKNKKADAESRTPLERMLLIHQEIAAGAFPNAPNLSKALNATIKTVERDIEFMRERLKLPIRYDSSHWGYYYANPTNVEFPPNPELPGKDQNVSMVRIKRSLSEVEKAEFVEAFSLYRTQILRSFSKEPIDPNAFQSAYRKLRSAEDRGLNPPEWFKVDSNLGSHVRSIRERLSGKEITAITIEHLLAEEFNPYFERAGLPAITTITVQESNRGSGVIWLFAEPRNDAEQRGLGEMKEAFLQEGYPTRELKKEHLPDLDTRLKGKPQGAVFSVIVLSANHRADLIIDPLRPLLQENRVLLVVVGDELATRGFYSSHNLPTHFQCRSWMDLGAFSSAVISHIRNSSKGFVWAQDRTNVSDSTAQTNRFNPSRSSSNHLPGISNDTTDGKPYIDISADVDSIARVICMKQVIPPLSIALFGNWGSGKSFFMEQVRQKVKQIRGSIPDDESNNPFHTEIIQIGFNAWHYVEASLWASLVTHIFENLKTPGLENSEKQKNEQEALLGQLGIAQKNRETAKDNLACAIRSEASAQRELLEKENQRQEKVRTLDEVRTQDIFKSILGANESDISAKLSELKTLLGLHGVVKTVEDAERVLTEANAVGGDIAKFIRTFISAPGFNKRWKYIVLSISAIVIIPSIFTIVADVRGWPEWTTVLKWLGTIAGGVGALCKPISETVANLRSALGKLQGANTEFADLVAKRTKIHDDAVSTARQQLKVASSAVATAAVKLKDAEIAIASAEEALAKASPRALLNAFIEERAASDDYRKNLGMLALIRRDFARLSQLLKDVRINPTLPQHQGLPRIDRIILYIDDLDRCPPKQVVEVLQAIHLLLAFELFVVVVGVDPRWVSHSLTVQYRNMLVDSINGGAGTLGMASPQDYLEKIFQIPFWIKPLTSHNTSDLIDGIAKSAIIHPALPSDTENADSVSELLPTDDASAIDESVKQSVASGVQSPIHDAKAKDEPSYADVVLNEGEIAFLKKQSHLIGTTPRAIKRYVNIYRILRARIPKEGLQAFLGNEGEPKEFESVILLICLFSADSGFAQSFVSTIENHPRVEGTEELYLLSEVLDEFKEGKSFSPGESHLYNQIHEYCETFENAHLKPTVEPFFRWGSTVSRYSFGGKIS